MVKIMKSDGNGGYVIQKGVFALITVIIVLLSCVVTVVAYGVTIKSDVNFLKEEYASAGPRHTQAIDEIETRINGCEKANAETRVLITEMYDDIKEIKIDIKGLIRK